MCMKFVFLKLKGLQACFSFNTSFDIEYRQSSYLKLKRQSNEF